ncbi:MAG TPA: NUDIX domain-containing protein [Streptosporangiaceae bacterium]
MTGYARRAARVLLIDSAGRLLLVRSALVIGRPEAGYAWFTPGGGVEPGESLAVAAARELREETGLDAAPGDLLPVAYTVSSGDFGWVSGRIRDDFFLLRVPGHEVDTAGLTDFERRHYGGHHWWTPAELAEPDEMIVPPGLPGLAARLTAGWRPPAPLELPAHDPGQHPGGLPATSGFCP